MEKQYTLPRPGQGPCSIEKIACNLFKVEHGNTFWSLSIVYRFKGKKFLSVLILETGKQYTHIMS